MERGNLVVEKRVVETMIRLYCKRKHHRKDICKDCAHVLAYAHERIDRCPEGMHKPFCSRCTIHCYAPEMRVKIRAVMRFSGPRMLLYHPLVALHHMFASIVSR